MCTSASVIPYPYVTVCDGIKSVMFSVKYVSVHTYVCWERINCIVCGGIYAPVLVTIPKSWASVKG